MTEAETPPRMTFIYFVRAGDAVKIGMSHAPEERIVDLQTAQHEKLELLGTFPGERCDEQDLHRAFSAFHIRGEWFRADPGLIAALRWAERREREWMRRTVADDLRPALDLAIDMLGNLLAWIEQDRDCPKIVAVRLKQARIARSLIEYLTYGLGLTEDLKRAQRETRLEAHLAALRAEERRIPPHWLDAHEDRREAGGEVA